MIAELLPINAISADAFNRDAREPSPLPLLYSSSSRSSEAERFALPKA